MPLLLIAILRLMFPKVADSSRSRVQAMVRTVGSGDTGNAWLLGNRNTLLT